MAKLKAKAAKKQVAKVKGHGDYKLIQETNFLKKLPQQKKLYAISFIRTSSAAKLWTNIYN